MVTKSSDARINEVLNFLGQTTLLRYGEKQYVKAYLETYLQNRFPGGSASDAQFKAFSADLSMAGVANPGNADQRMIRRALALLWTAIGNAGQAAAAKTLATGALQEALRDTTRKALMCAGAAAATDWPARYVLESVFAANPLAFLGRNTIMILGSTRVSGRDQNPVSMQFYYDAVSDRYTIKPATHPEQGARVFDAAHVTAVNWWDVPGRGNDLNRGSFAQIHGTELSGDIMVTTQFTGCSFCIKPSGGHVYAAHVSPSDVRSEFAAFKTDGTTLSRQVCGDVPAVTAGDFANAPGAGPFQVYGRGRGTGNFPGGYEITPGAVAYMCIIGFNRDGAWALYSQSVSPSKTVVNARQIFP